MSWKLAKVHNPKPITRKLAQEFAEMEKAPQDRPLSERRLQIYERLAHKGEFRPLTWSRAICAETNDIYRVNGKHTSTLFSTIEPLPVVYVTIEDYECDTLEDVSRLYSTFDDKAASRSALDIYRAFASSVEELRELPLRVVAMAISGIAYNTWQENYSRVYRAAERAELILDEPAFAVYLSELCQGDCKHITRVPVVAAIYGSWKKNQAKSREFWTAVRDETGTTTDLPDRKLAKWLVRSSVNHGRGAGALNSLRASDREFYVRCIKWWNNWRKGESGDVKYFKDAKVPAFA